MGGRILSFHFDYLSPYSYLAWHRIQGLARKHGLEVEVKPTLLAALLNHHGHKGPAEIASKRAYMFADCVRGAALLDLPFAPVASHPFNPLAALRATLLDMDESTRSELVTQLFHATWALSRDVGSPAVVAEVCDAVGVPDAASRIQDPRVKKRLRDESAAAIARGVFGVPTRFVEGELFFGSDSVPHLERFLEGRDPLRREDVECWAAVPASARR